MTILNYNLLNETFTILLQGGDLISATSLYLDSGSGFATTKQYEYFQVCAKSGIFEQCQYVKILYNNSNPKESYAIF